MMGDWFPTPAMEQETGTPAATGVDMAGGVVAAQPLRSCPHCRAWVPVRKGGLMRAHWRAELPSQGRCAGEGELPWPWESEAEEADFGFNGRWKMAALGGSWYPAANNPRKVDEWYLCRRRLGATSIQFGPMHYKAAIALADHFNYAPELHHYHGHPMGDSSVWEEPSAEELTARGLPPRP